MCAIVVGQRKGFGVEAMPPHNLPMTVLGAGLLWFGWFGFNAGSALGANGLAVSAFVATHIAACAGGFGWMVAGDLQVRIDQKFPMAEAAEAHRYLEARKTKGKVLLIP